MWPKRKRKYEDGRVVDLCWDGIPGALYVIGHVNSEEFTEACNSQYGDDWKEYKLGPIEHVYGRWSTEWPVSNDLGCQILRIYANSAPRRFPVTQREVLSMQVATT